MMFEGCYDYIMQDKQLTVMASAYICVQYVNGTNNWESVRPSLMHNLYAYDAI